MPLLDLQDSGTVKVFDSSTTDPTLIKAKGRVDEIHVESSRAGFAQASSPEVKPPSLVRKGFGAALKFVLSVAAAVVAGYIGYTYFH